MVQVVEEAFKPQAGDTGMVHAIAPPKPIAGTEFILLIVLRAVFCGIMYFC